jgi:toxin ParE1/3/4
MRIEWSDHAFFDLKIISEFIEQDRDIGTANRVSRTIYDTIQTLPAMPYRGRYGRLENTRELVIPRLPYVVIYRLMEDRIVILNIVHGAQRWS